MQNLPSQLKQYLFDSETAAVRCRLLRGALSLGWLVLWAQVCTTLSDAVQRYSPATSAFLLLLLLLVGLIGFFIGRAAVLSGTVTFAFHLATLIWGFILCSTIIYVNRNGHGLNQVRSFGAFMTGGVIHGIASSLLLDILVTGVLLTIAGPGLSWLFETLMDNEETTIAHLELLWIAAVFGLVFVGIALPGIAR